MSLYSSSSRNPKFLFWLHLLLLLLHQTEEYIYPGGFKETVSEIFPLLNIPQLTDRKAFYVNVILGWGLFILAAIIGLQAVWFPSGLLLFMLGNAAGHIGAPILKRSYHPGFFVSLLLNAPFSIFVLLNLYSAGFLGIVELSLTIVVTILTSLTMFLILLKL
jgi:hypothetical protein